MNIHSLAKTTPQSRARIVSSVIERRQAPAAVAASAGISVRTVYKWLRRFREEGLGGLRDRSSRPQRSPRRLGAQLVAAITELRQGAWLNASQIARQLQLARSTVARWIARLGLVRRSAPPRPPVQRYEHPQPGAMLHLDCKKLGRFAAAGHALTGDRSRRSRGAGWEIMHVCVDDHSRVAYCEILPDELGSTAAAFLRRVVAQFAAWGVPVLTLLTDNGACYRSKVFKAACRELDVRQHFTRPYHPQTNGKAERFIRTVMQECLYASRLNCDQERHTALRSWLLEYNHSRPHSALGCRPPFSRMPSCE